MKKYFLFLLSVLAVLSLNAQAELAGTWTGKAVKNGQPMGFKMQLQKNGNFSMAYDLNPNELSYKGKWSFKDGVLGFKNSDGILMLKLGEKGEGNKESNFSLGLLTDDGTLVLYQIKGSTRIMGWEESGPRVVVNHEEMY